MESAVVVAPELVRQEWEQMESWSPARAAREARQFTHDQPAVTAYVYALLEEQGLAVSSFGLELAHTVERVYRRALGATAVSVSERDVEIAAEETEKRIGDLVGVEPELAFRQMFFRRDLAAPGLVTELITLLMESAEGEPAQQAALGALFIATVGIAKAYERAYGLAGDDVPKSSIGAAIEARTGRPLPKIGRNEPCPCGSGLKFKKCCGQWHEPPPPPAKSHAEQLFTQYMSTVESVWGFLQDRKRDRDAKWVRKRSEEFETRFAPGAPGGVPDSLHVSYTLFDLRIPRCGKTIAEIFLEQEGRQLDAGERARLRALCDSYAAFYELVELLPGEGKKRLRELGSGTEWLVNEVEDAGAESGEPGEIWLCRFVGPREDAVTFMTALVYPSDMREPLEKLVRAFVERGPASGLPIVEAIPATMKHAAEALAEVVIATSPDDDELDEDGDDLDDAEGGVAFGVPRLANTDGEPLLPTKLFYDLDGARDAFEKLRDLAGPNGMSDDEAEWAADGSLTHASIAWLDPEGILPGGTVRGWLRFGPGQLVVEVNSAERAERVRALIAERLGETARLRRVEEEPLEDALQKATADPDWPAKARAEDERQLKLFQENPGLRRHMENYLNSYYQGWLDRPLPALNGKTPRAAVASKTGRKQVRALLDEIELMEASRPLQMPRVDVESLRRELRLDR